MAMAETNRTGHDPRLDKTIDLQKERLEERKANEEKKLAGQLPKPAGYKLLIALPEAEEKTSGGIIKAAETKHIEEISSVCGFVMALGPEAYKDKNKFSEPWCKEGDWVMMRGYAGTRFSIHGKEFRLINDDSVEAVVDDPRGIRKL